MAAFLNGSTDYAEKKKDTARSRGIFGFCFMGRMRTSAAALRLPRRFGTKRSAEPDVVSEPSPQPVDYRDNFLANKELPLSF
jgi:hypothetical protein